MDPRCLTVYKASAGSGKTYALTREYILALIGVKNPADGTYRLNHPHYSPTGRALANRHRGILAITFTNKATDEMKERITVKLRALTFLPDPGEKDADYADEFTAKLGCTRQELAEAAQTALEQLLHDFQNFNVSTIDAFFQRVLRVFARELDRQGDYEVELDQDAVMRAAVNRLLDDFNLNQHQKRDLKRWILSRMKESLAQGKRANIMDRRSGPHRELVAVMARITGEDFARYEKNMREYLNASPSKINQFNAALRRRREDIDAESRSIASDAIAAVEAYGPKHDVKVDALNFLRKFANGEKPSDKTAANGLARALAGNVRNKNCICPLEVTDALCAATIRCVELMSLKADLMRMIEIATKLAFVGYAWRYVDEIYEANNTLLLADTNAMINHIIDGCDVPFIYERLGMQLHHFLIDEFQDTSILQWANLRPLVANALHDYHDCLIIGDVKQSIYRFRNSAPDLLDRQVEHDDFPGMTIARGTEPADNTNHRSSREVVVFNNTLFSRLASLTRAVGYANVVQPPKQEAPGYVRFFKCEIPEGADKNADPFADAPQLALMASEMMRQHREGGYAWSDIAILGSRHDDNARAIEYLLRFTPIPVLAEEGLFLHKSPAVKLIIALLRMVDLRQTTPDICGAAPRFLSMADMQLILSRFEFYVTAQAIEPEVALEKAFGDRADIDAVVAAIIGPGTNSVAELVEDIILQFISPEMRDSNSAYLAAFQDYVAEYTRTNPESLHGFLGWWDDNCTKLSIPVGGDIDAVRVMTIHKSKGLEFDCVHIPFPLWRQYTVKGMEWEDTPPIDGIDPSLLPPGILVDGKKDLSDDTGLFGHIFARRRDASAREMVNLTYVAFTRAVRELCVYVPDQAALDKKKGGGNTAPFMLEAVMACLAAAPTEQELATPHTMDLAEHFSEADSTYCLGQPTRKVHRPAAADHVVTLPPVHPGYPVWDRDSARVLSSPDSPQELSADVSDRPAQGPDADDFEIDPESRERGLLMHEILQNVNSAADLPAAAAAVAARQHFPVAQVRAAAAALAQALDLSRPELARWFRDFRTALCEQSIFINQGNDHGSRRPDRIVFLADGSAEVVDYKFTTRTKASHIEQVRLYCRLLRAMGYTAVRGYLWYPLQPAAPTIKVTP